MVGLVTGWVVVGAPPALASPGRLRFVAATEPPLDLVVETGGSQPIPPEVEHHVEPLGPVRFTVQLLQRVDPT